MQIFVHVPHMMQVRLKRHTKPKWLWARARLPLEVAEFPAFDDPSAIVMAYDRRRGQQAPVDAIVRAGPKAHLETVERREPGLKARLWRPMRFGLHAVTPAILEAGHPKSPFLRALSQVRSERHEVTRLEDVADRDVVLTKANEIYVDGFDRAVARANRIAARLAVVGGMVVQQQPDPVWTVGLTGHEKHGVEVDFGRPHWEANPAACVAFRADALDQALNFARSLAEMNGTKVKEPWCRVEANPVYLSDDPAAVSARLMLKALGVAILEYPYEPAAQALNALIEGKADKAAQGWLPQEFPSGTSLARSLVEFLALNGSEFSPGMTCFARGRCSPYLAMVDAAGIETAPVAPADGWISEADEDELALGF